jgi:hypothetical protein
LTACADQTTQHSALYSPRIIENVLDFRLGD